MVQKESCEFELCQVRLARQRQKIAGATKESLGALSARMSELYGRLAALDEEISPFARQAGSLNNPHWGLLMRTGNDKSYFARQVERHADVYTSRVSNFLAHSPFVYLRSPRGSLPHDPTSPLPWSRS